MNESFLTTSTEPKLVNKVQVKSFKAMQKQEQQKAGTTTQNEVGLSFSFSTGSNEANRTPEEVLIQNLAKLAPEAKKEAKKFGVTSFRE